MLSQVYIRLSSSENSNRYIRILVAIVSSLLCQLEEIISILECCIFHTQIICVSIYLVFNTFQSVQFSSVAESCLTLCDPMNRSTPGLPEHHQLLEFTQTLVHRVSDAIQPSHPLSSPSPPAPQSLPASESFPISQLFTWGGLSTGVSALASVLPMNTQDWFPLGWTYWISLQSKWFSRVFSNTTIQKHQFFCAQLSL